VFTRAHYFSPLAAAHWRCCSPLAAGGPAQLVIHLLRLGRQLPRGARQLVYVCSSLRDIYANISPASQLAGWHHSATPIHWRRCCSAAQASALELGRPSAPAASRQQPAGLVLHAKRIITHEACNSMIRAWILDDKRLVWGCLCACARRLSLGGRQDSLGARPRSQCK